MLNVKIQLKPEIFLLRTIFRKLLVKVVGFQPSIFNLQLPYRFMVKLLRAYGGCLGNQRRRRTWQAAKSCGESRAGSDPQMSEWGNPIGRDPDDSTLNS